jgi:hypothetical protein
MSAKPKPPYLKEKKIITAMMLPASVKALLKEASAATGLSQSAYVERALKTQFGLDHLS